MSRTSSIVALAILVAGIVALTLLGLNGLQIGRYDVLPFSEAINQGLDLRGGVFAVYQAQDTSVADFSNKMDIAMNIMRTRLDSNNFTEATISNQGFNGEKIRVEIPGVSSPDEVFKLIGQPAQLEFLDPDGKIIMTGQNIKAASQGTVNGAAVVNFSLDGEGAKAFAEATARLVGQPIRILLDGKQISEPNVENPITGGEGYIEGNFTAASAQQLATQLQSGAIPIKLTQTEARSISATLGADALKTSVIAGAIALLIVMLFMMSFYRLPGFLAAIALAVFTLLNLYILAITGLQVTLPGVAGIILSIGMAVDANVLIFERIKDELRLGKTLRSAVDGGFRKAFITILDSNVTTVLAGLVLLLFGTGPVKGFAYTLILGVLVSMFTAITFTRFLMNIMIKLNITASWLYFPRLKKVEAVK